MAALSAGRDARPVAGNAVYYERHRPERTLLYQIIAEYYPAFLDLLSAQGRTLPAYVQREFEDYLRCGRLEHGFLRLRCEHCHAERLVAFSCKRRGFCPSCGARRMVESAALLVDEVLPREPLRQWVLSVPFALRFLLARQPAEIGSVLGIVYRAIATHLIKKAGLTHATGQTGAVTLIQRFGSALNLNIHFHMLCLDGVYVTGEDALCFWRVQPPTAAELDKLIAHISARVGRHLERQGLLVRDMENSYLVQEPENDAALDGLLSHSITYRIAVGPHQGRKAFTLQTLPADDRDTRQVANAAGFSLHAGVAAEADERQKLEWLCRYIARPAVSAERLSLTNQGHIRYALKTPYRDGTTHVIFEPLDFIARLAALVPNPRVNLTRFHEVHPCTSPLRGSLRLCKSAILPICHGVFAPNSHLRAQVTPGKRGRRTSEEAGRAISAGQTAMTWGQRLKRVFRIDIEMCDHCGGVMKVAALAHPCARGIRASMHIIACIDDPVVIKQILEHLDRCAQQPPAMIPLARAPPESVSNLKE